MGCPLKIVETANGLLEQVLATQGTVNYAQRERTVSNRMFLSGISFIVDTVFNIGISFPLVMGWGCIKVEMQTVC